MTEVDGDVGPGAATAGPPPATPATPPPPPPPPEAAGEALDYDRLMTEPPAGGLGRVPALLWGAIKLVRAAAPRPLRWATLLQATNGILTAAQLLAVKLLLDRLLSDEPTFGAILTPLLVLVGVYAVAAASATVLAEQKRLVQELTGYHTTTMLLDAATSVDLLDLERPQFHDRLLRAQINSQSRPIQMVDGALGFVSAAVGAAGVAVALVILQPLFLVIVLLAFAPAWILVQRASRSTYRYGAAQARRDRRRSYLAMVLVGKQDAKEVRAYDLGPPLTFRHDRLYEERIADTRDNVRERTRLGLAGAATTATLAGVTVAALAWYATSGRTSLSAAGAATAALLLLVQRLQSLQGSLATLYESSLFIEDFTGFVADLQEAHEERPTTPAPADPRQIVAADVVFRYPSSPGDVLHDVSLTLRRGEVVALVGENGSGKTTLAKILAGLFRPTGGTVTWDGVDLAACDDRTIRDQVAVLFQDFSHFQLTLAENVELGRWTDAADGTRRDDAVTRAGLGDVVAALPDGVDTNLGPEFLGGIDLSGGQWQRLALARALFRRAPLVILDEPTAALDPKAESELYERTRLLYAGSAVLLISHRLNSVRTADRIYVLDGGRVVEQGTHDELMEVRGVYADLFSRQAAGYVS